MHPTVALMLRNPQNRATAAHILARQGNHGDSMLAHINPAEAMMLKQVGGVGTVNPKTGLRQFWEDGGGAGNSAGADSGHQGDGNGGGGAKGGNGGGNSGANQGSGGYTGTHAGGPGFGSGPTGSPSGGGGQYGSNGGYNGGITVNPGRSIASLGLGLIPGVGPILSGLNSAFGPTIGPSFNFGGTTNGYAIDGSKTGVYGTGWGGGGPGNVGSNVGQNGMGQQGSMGGWGGPGGAAGGAGAPGTTPAPATPPAGLPPAVLQALAGMYAQGPQSDPFAGRFGKMPVTQPYLVANNQPQGQGYLTGLIN